MSRERTNAYSDARRRPDSRRQGTPPWNRSVRLFDSPTRIAKEDPAIWRPNDGGNRRGVTPLSGELARARTLEEARVYTNPCALYISHCLARTGKGSGEAPQARAPRGHTRDHDNRCRVIFSLSFSFSPSSILFFYLRRAINARDKHAKLHTDLGATRRALHRLTAVRRDERSRMRR